jgi:DNA methyltransferase 1-associated protein 1
MPTRENVEILDSLLIAAGSLVDMKREVNRVESNLKQHRMQKEGFVPPISRTRTVSETLYYTYLI